MSQSALTPVFNALSGPELKKYILSEIEKKLDATGEFNNHVAFPWVKVTYSVSVLAYPKQSQEDEPAIKAVDEKELGQAPEPSTTTISLVVEDSKTITVPDQARVDSNQPFTRPATDVKGVIVDKPVVAKTELKKVPHAGSGTKSQSQS